MFFFLCSFGLPCSYSGTNFQVINHLKIQLLVCFQIADYQQTSDYPCTLQPSSKFYTLLITLARDLAINQ